MSALRDIARVGLDAFNKVLSPLDSYFAKDGPSVGPPLFIVGVPRSGTTLTYQVITQQFRVAYFTSAMGYFYGMPNLVMRLLRPFIGRPSPVYESTYGSIKGVFSPSEHANFWFRWFPRESEFGHYVEPEGLQVQDYETLKPALDSVAAICGKPLVVKSAYLIMAVGALSKILPDARFVFVRRDPFYNCQSLLVRRLSQRNPNTWWSVKPPQYQSIRSLPVWRQVTEQFFFTNKIIERELEALATERYLNVSYEALCDSPRDFIYSLAHWLSDSGYQLYEDMRVPENFSSANKATLENGLAEKIRHRLFVLEDQYSSALRSSKVKKSLDDFS